jgi:hypothetical protein
MAVELRARQQNLLPGQAGSEPRMGSIGMTVG